MNCNPPKSDSLNNRVAYVLPKDYGYGFRGMHACQMIRFGDSGKPMLFHTKQV